MQRSTDYYNDFAYLANGQSLVPLMRRLKAALLSLAEGKGKRDDSFVLIEVPAPTNTLAAMLHVSENLLHVCLAALMYDGAVAIFSDRLLVDTARMLQGQ